MNQLKTIDKLKEVLPTIKGLCAAILYGSFGRKEANPNSDMDVQLLVEKRFSLDDFINLLHETFGADIIRIQKVDLRQKLVVYFRHQPKLEFSIHHQISELKRNYLGSNITDIKSSLLYSGFYHGVAVIEYLKRISNEAADVKSKNELVTEFKDKFIYEFENCSTMHKRSDGYQFYFFYNIALHTAVQLNQLSKGDEAYLFLPKRYIPKLASDEEREEFYKLNGSLFLPESNKKKRALLDYFTIQLRN